MELPKEYAQDEGLRTLANFLRSDNGVKIYKAVEHEKRVEYFKGKAFIDTLLNIGVDVDPKKSKKWPKSIPKITDKAVAIAVGNALLNKNFFHRSDKAEVKKGSERILTVSPVQIFEEAGVYTWIYQGGMLFRYIMSGYVSSAYLSACLPACLLDRLYFLPGSTDASCLTFPCILAPHTTEASSPLSSDSRFSPSGQTLRKRCCGTFQ